MNTTRRDFLKVSAGAVAATSGVPASSKEVSSLQHQGNEQQGRRGARAT